MELLNIKTAFSDLKTFYGIDMKESDFEEIALKAWELIGNKHTEIKEYIGDSHDRILELPCDCVDIETVSLPIIDSNTTGTLIDGLDEMSIATEMYIEHRPKIKDVRYTEEKLLKYKYSGNRLQFDRDYANILVKYHGVIKDGDDLPLVNSKEIFAIATYAAYAATYKEGLMKKDGNIINLANTMKADWLRACNAARISDHLTQNDMDAILDAKYSYDRKHYGVSYKPIK